MGVTLRQITSNTAQVTLSVGEDNVTVEYYPGKITEKALAQLQGFVVISSDDNDGVMAGFASLNEMLATIIKSWDVYEDDEQSIMFPIDASRFSELPMFFRARIMQAIMVDIRPEQVAP